MMERKLDPSRRFLMSVNAAVCLKTEHRQRRSGGEEAYLDELMADLEAAVKGFLTRVEGRACVHTLLLLQLGTIEINFVLLTQVPVDGTEIQCSTPAEDPLFMSEAQTFRSLSSNLKNKITAAALPRDPAQKVALFTRKSHSHIR